MDVVALSRLQFGLTALYHFLFVPLTLGLAVLLVIMEAVYVTTGRTIWRDMVKFWGVLFGINFVMGVATGITMEFQFGTNWAYYAHYVGDIFGAPLAIEGLMAFFLEATFVGLFFFGWDRLSKIQHLFVTCMVAMGTNLSALWILIANGWMQHPVGAHFDIATMSMQVNDFTAVLMNENAQDKFVHTVAAGYVVGSMFMLSVSAMYLLMGKHRAMALRSMTVAASFGLAASLAVVTLGDASGETIAQDQPMKMAAIEGMWQTEAAPAGFNLVGLPDQATHATRDEIHIPWVLGLIATHSTDIPIRGIDTLVQQNVRRVESGQQAYGALLALRSNPQDAAAQAAFAAHEPDLGFGLLLKTITPNVTDATPAEVQQAAWASVPPVATVFWSFRIMVGLGLLFHPAVRDDVLSRLHAPAGYIALAALGDRVFAPAALDRRRNGLDHGGGRPPALDDRRYSADGALGLLPARGACGDFGRGLRGRLFRAAGSRAVPDGAHHPQRARAGPSRARLCKTRARPAAGIATGGMREASHE